MCLGYLDYCFSLKKKKNVPNFLIASPWFPDTLSERRARYSQHTLVSKGNQFIEELLYDASHFRADGGVSERHPSAPVTPTSVHAYRKERGNLPLGTARVFPLIAFLVPEQMGKFFALRPRAWAAGSLNGKSHSSTFITPKFVIPIKQQCLSTYINTHTCVCVCNLSTVLLTLRATVLL